MEILGGLLWLLIGAGSFFLHAFLVQRALGQVTGLSPTDAGHRMRKGLPLRLLALTPVLLIAARTGLVACVGWTVGSLLGCWLVASQHARLGRWLLTVAGR